jgi:aminopeptidase N
MRTDTGQVFRLEDYRPSDYLIPEVDLAFRLDPEKTLVTARLSVERREGIEPGAPLVLDGDGLVLEKLLIDGEPVGTDAFEATPDSLTIRKPPHAARFELTIVTHVEPSANKALMGLYVSNGVYCTQCEAEGFRRITYYLDRPDVLSTYRVRIEARFGTKVIEELRRRGHDVPGLDLAIDSDIPLGAGLSSSAALTCATALAAADLGGLDLDRAELARVAQAAENDFVGVPCGMLDQLAALCCIADHAMFLDVRTGDTDAHRAFACHRIRLRHRAFEPIGDEGKRRIRTRPPRWHRSSGL